jgi:hypothetical protein
LKTGTWKYSWRLNTSRLFFFYYYFKIITKPYLTIYSNFQTDSLIYPQTSDADMKFCLLLERIQLRVSYEINYSHPCLMKMEKKTHFVTQIPTHIICNAAYHIESMHESLEDSFKN